MTTAPAPTPEPEDRRGPELGTDPEALNALLAKCQAEQREPTDEEIVAILGVQGMMALGASFEGDTASRSRFQRWNRMVISPLGLPVDAAHDLFVGKISIEEYVATLSDEEAERFVRNFPELQARYHRVANQSTDESTTHTNTEGR